MKKALVILMALSMVFAAFADEPAVKNEVVEFKGDASVTWGVNLDSGKTGFTNSTSASVKFDVFGQASKSTTGDGIWGEIAVKLDSDDGLRYANGEWNGVKAKVDSAKLHINDMITVGILSGSNAYGEYKPVLAVFSDKGHLKTDSVGGTVANGITIGVALPDLLDVSVDFRSAPETVTTKTHTATLKEPTWDFSDVTKGKNENGVAWTIGSTYLDYLVAKAKYDADVAKETAGTTSEDTYYTNHYGVGTTVAVKAVDNLGLKLGFGIDFFAKNPWGLSASADYKLGITDTIYVKPQIGFTMTDAKKSGKIAFAALVGWGDENQDTNIHWLSKKVSDGFSVATNIPLDFKEIPLCVGVYDSKFVENLKVGAQFHVNNLKKFAVNTLVFEFTYDLGDIVPAVSFAWDNNGDLGWKTEAMKLYVGVDYKAFANTTLSLAYESGNFKAKTGKAGTINLTAKISF